MSHPSTLLAERLALAFGAVAFLVALATIVHAVIRVSLARAMAPRIQEGSDAVVEALTAGGIGAAAVRLRRLSERRILDVLLPFATRVSGGNARSLADLARLAGVEELGRKWRRSRTAWRRLHGARVGALLGGPSDDIARLLTDPSADVRAATAEWAATGSGPDTAEALLGLLDDPSPGCTFAAMDALVALGTSAAPSLAIHLTASDPAHLLKCLKVSTHIADPSLGATALPLLDHQDPRVRTAAATLLGVSGGEWVTDRLLLSTLDTEPAVRAAAASSLGRLRVWKAAAPLGSLLRDPAWAVRRSSVFALLDLGSPGMLVLRNALHDEDRFAADIARLALGLPPQSAAVP